MPISISFFSSGLFGSRSAMASTLDFYYSTCWGPQFSRALSMYSEVLLTSIGVKYMPIVKSVLKHNTGLGMDCLNWGHGNSEGSVGLIQNKQQGPDSDF